MMLIVGESGTLMVVWMMHYQLNVWKQEFHGKFSVLPDKGRSGELQIQKR